ncbi:MAG: 3-phosphoshikimate 1-carboxyvinyltransferase [Candidatus Dormibacteraeota bacterium]|uniref:3-phosphoshikimate 1-carboxyvinyltransferase n=1 Tax=Candidatus Dormiibacter inghamiae TaxID=3127013 RepID=A0A934KKE0_9BACT|nr:3-phosphoshikimate 1-carboxyvinyltransferase [Candidatus Dormibacteraeota bacterium]MBJ7604835.1 3-phosphoshikimate 1-carboxyvinyltransferase [Candidatus Dormibacteraeota bacterium]
MSTVSVRSPRRLAGTLRLPGDKSISHRALILNAIAHGRAQLRGLSQGADVASTAGCLRALGAEMGEGWVKGRGLAALRPAPGPLDCGNSGTTMRLLAGLLAGRPFPSTLIGDDSLSRRPMDRVVVPLRQMGAAADQGSLRVGGRPLRGIRYASPVASAQVKSALLLAGLSAEGRTEITEPAHSRDHSERMLAALGAPLDVAPRRVAIDGPFDALQARDVEVPGDFSAAAFWLVAASLHPEAELRLLSVGQNPTRTALLDVLRRMGATFSLSAEQEVSGEPFADMEISTAAQLRPIQLQPNEAAYLIDELPVLAVAASLLPGTSRLTGAAELRLKESDRIAAMAEGLDRLGVDVRELADGWEIIGPACLRGARVSSHGDHRVAMALAVAALLAEGETEIESADCVDISYPNFWQDLERVCVS